MMEDLETLVAEVARLREQLAAARTRIKVLEQQLQELP